MDDPTRQACRSILDGYSLAELPDLSNTRTHPQSGIGKTVITFDASSLPRTTNPNALALVAYAYILGLYCSVTDVLIGLLAPPDERPFPFRLQWDDQTTWATAVCSALSVFDGSNDLHIPPRLLQQTTELKEGDSPFIAFFSRSCDEDQKMAMTTPLRLCQLKEGQLSLLFAFDRIHVSVATTLLRQVASLMVQAATAQTSRMVVPFTLTDDLSSTVEVLPPESRASYYSHVPPVHIATDAILPHVESTPSATAVCWYPRLDRPGENIPDWQSLTYRDLHLRGNRFARFLVQMGLSLEDRVAVCMDRDPTFHVVLFGILRAGGCYVPIDPELPRERKLYIAEDSGAKFVIVSSTSLGAFGDVESIDIDSPSVQEILLDTSDANVDPPSTHSLAYMLYTSGTTGNPKGCLLTHEGLSEAILALSFFAADVRMEDIRNGRYLAVASMAFDVHLAEIFVPLLLGMTIVGAPRSELLENLAHYINYLDITHVGLVPSLIDATMTAVKGDDAGSAIKLRYIASGGEKISDSILDKWGEHPKVRLANFYGPSEVTIGCCARFVDSSTPTGNIGRPFANVSSYVVDRDLNILPRGAVGELVVAGPLVGRGYHRLPDLTANAFIEWPRTGSRAYRTGDLVRMLPDGTLDIIGRIDAQIKLRGVRIETEGIAAVLRHAARRGLGLPLEAETILTSHPSIANGNAPQLVSFVAWDYQVPVATRRVVKPNIIPFSKGLLEALRAGCEELPSYMRPAHIIPLSWFPLNPNGKVDNKALAHIFKETVFDTLISLGHSTVCSTADHSPAPGVVEKLVSRLSRQLKIHPSLVNIHANLFGYGLDSLSLAQFTSDLNRAFDVSVSVADIMQNPSIAGISTLLKPASANARSCGYVKRFSEEWLPVIEKVIPPTRIERVLPPLPIQAGVLYHSDSVPTSCVQHVIMKISDAVTNSRLRDAWQATMHKLEILRTVFFFGSQLVQVILRPDECVLPWLEKPPSADNDNTFCTSFLADEASSLAVDINQSSEVLPLFRLTAYLQQDDRRLVLSIHHSLFDGVSLPVVLKFVEDELFRRSSELVCSMDGLLENIYQVETSAARDFWTSLFSSFDWSTYQLKGIPPSAQPQQKLVPITKSLSTIQGLVASHNVTLQAVLMYAFAVLLSQHIQCRDDIVFGAIRSGRLLPVDGIGTVPYPMLTVLPVRIRLSLEDCLRRIQEDISATVAFEHLSLSKIQSWIRPGYQLVDTLFAVTVKDETSFEAWHVLHSDLSRPDFPLSVEVLLDRKKDTLVIRAAYYECDNLPSAVEHALANFEVILFHILEHGFATSFPVTIHGDLEKYPEPAERVTKDPVHKDDVSGTLDLQPLNMAVSEFLRVSPEHILPTTSLISMGLDSIRAIGLSRVLRQRGYNVNAADILRHPTLRQLSVFTHPSRRVQQEASDTSNEFLHQQLEKLRGYVDPSTHKLCAEDEVSLFPTTELQAGMLSQARTTLATSGQLYFHAFAMTLEPQTNLSRLQTAWGLVVQHLSILRTTFHYVSIAKTWIQACHTAAPCNWAVHTKLTEESLQDSIKMLVANMEAIDESAFTVPPVYLRLIQGEGEDGTHLVLLMHHALYDGLSVAKLLEVVEQVYLTQSVPISVQFFDLLPRILLEQHLATAYWVQKLQHYRPPHFPIHALRGSPEAVVSSRVVSFSQQKIRQVLYDTGATLQCIGQAVWAKFVAKLTSSLDIVFGHVVSGRSLDGAEDVVGPMLTTIPFRVEFVAGMSNRDLVRQIHQNNVDALSWQHVSLRAIQAGTGFEGLFHSLFVFQPMFSSHHSKIWKMHASEEFGAHVQYPLNVEFYELEEGLLVKMACLQSVMDRHKIETAMGELQDMVNEIINHPEHMPLGDGDVTTAVHEDVSDVLPTRAPPEVSSIPPAFADVLSSITGCHAEDLDPSLSLTAVGVDSITAIALGAKCREVGLRVTVADIVSSRCIGDLVYKSRIALETATVDTTVDVTGPTGVSPEEFAKIVKRFPAVLQSQIASVTHATEGMKWLIGAWQNSGHSRFQHVFAYEAKPTVALEGIRKGWEALIAYHPILRSTFACMPGGTEPCIVTFSEDAKIALEEERVEELADGDLQSQIENRMRAIISSPIAPSAPQTRGILLSCHRKTYLLLRMHHFQYDAFSLSLLLGDLTLLCQGYPPASIPDMAAFLRSFNASPSLLSGQETYWKSAIPSLVDPSYFPPLITEVRSPQRTIVTARAAVVGLKALESKAQALDLTLTATLLACWATVQSIYTCCKTVIFGLWHAGRTGSVQGVEKFAFPCMNVLPVYLNVADDMVQGARCLQEDLHRRTPIVQQTRLEDVDTWVTQGKRLPLTNVFVNIFRSSQGPADTKIFKAVEVDYSVPEDGALAEASVIDELSIAQLIKDDLMIDIVIDEKLDAITMSVESAPALMDKDHAMEVIKRWSATVEKFLSLAVNDTQP
ncbi:hypothetical protein EDC04DRAFT_3104410 [Pisolithus marmoratus]|nr:hypothetical protein EDC04DRAFT_3104410 [Pisolithus marmoratus]